MSFRDWPSKIEGNIFSLAKLDPKSPPELRVVTWSSIFSDGGSVAVEVYGADGKRLTPGSLASIAVKENRVVLDERDHLQGLVDEFNADLAKNWSRLIRDARKKVTAYHREQAKQHAEALANAEKGIFS